MPQKTQILKAIFACLIFGAVLSFTPVCQAKSTKKSLAVYLIQKLNLQLPYHQDDEFAFTQELTFSPDHCTLTLRTFSSLVVNQKGKLESEIVTKLSNFSPKKIEIVENMPAFSINPGIRLSLNTTNNQEVGVLKTYNSISGKYLGANKFSSMMLSGIKKEEAQKIANAFRDLITQCGGKN